MTGGLRSRRRLRKNEDVDPLEGSINIVDAMLVFACGLMLALVIRWNVDLGQVQGRVNVSAGQEVPAEASIRDDLAESPAGTGKIYEEVGTVYKDPVSGELFMLTNK